MATECPLCGDEYEIVISHISRSHTDKEYKSVLLKELERLANEYEKTPTIPLIKSKGKFSATTYHLTFGSWNEALKEAGFEINQEKDITKDRLLEELQRLANEYEKTPTIPLVDSKGKFGVTTYQNVFGSWNEALKEAGLEVNVNTDFDKEDLLNELQRLYDEYNKTPTKRLMNSEGKFSHEPYQTNFGSWNEALKEAGLEINNSGMCDMEQSVYVLDCGNNKYYVGVSAHPDARLQEHKNKGRRSSQWTREHGVKERIYLSDPMPHEQAYQKEREKTLEIMREHGWENVRGSQWLSVELESPPEPLEMNQKI